MWVKLKTKEYYTNSTGIPQEYKEIKTSKGIRNPNKQAIARLEVKATVNTQTKKSHMKQTRNTQRQNFS